MNYNINDLEEIIELKKYSKKIMIWLIILAVASIPCVVLALNILQGTAEFNNIMVYFTLLIPGLPSFLIAWYKYNKQFETAAIAIFKHMLLKIGSDEFTSEEEKKKLCEDLKQYLDNSNITNVNHIFKLKRDYKTIDFFGYEIINQTTISNNSQFDMYVAMLLESSENGTLEKYEKILLEKNDKLNFKYYIMTSNNKIIISILRNSKNDITKEMLDPIADLFIQMLEEIK